MNLGYLLAGLIFLFNPNINVIDVLPDFIGCIFIVKGLSKLSDLDRRIASAKAKFRRLAWVALFKAFVSLFTSGLLDQALYGMGLSILVDLFDSTMVLVFVFVFGIFELMYMIPAFISLFEGIAFLEIRHTNHRARRTNFAKPRFGGIFDKVEFADGTAYFEVYTDRSDVAQTAKMMEQNVFFAHGKEKVFLSDAGFAARNDDRLYLYESDEARTMSVIFVLTRAIATFLPELTVLSGTGGGYVQSGGGFTFSGMHDLLSYALAAIALLIGSLWLVRMIRYFRGFMKDEAFVTSLEKKYAADVLSDKSLWTMRKTLSFCSLAASAYFFFLCVKLDWYYFIPEFAFGIVMLYAFYRAGDLAPEKREYRGKLLAFILFSAVSYGLLFTISMLFGGSAFPYLEKGFTPLFAGYMTCFAVSMFFYFLLVSVKKKTLLRMMEACTALSCPANADGTNYHRDVLRREIGKKIRVLSVLERIYAPFSVLCMFATVPFSEDYAICGLAWIFRILFGGAIVLTYFAITDSLQNEFEKVVVTT